MIIIISAHAQKRMKSRNVSENQILQVLEQHDFSSSTRQDSTLLVKKFADGRELKVWVVGELPIGVRVIIKSVAWKGE